MSDNSKKTKEIDAEISAEIKKRLEPLQNLIHLLKYHKKYDQEQKMSATSSFGNSLANEEIRKAIVTSEEAIEYLSKL